MRRTPPPTFRIAGLCVIDMDHSKFYKTILILSMFYVFQTILREPASDLVDAGRYEGDLGRDIRMGGRHLILPPAPLRGVVHNRASLPL
jgi:hypothetical protein